MVLTTLPHQVHIVRICLRKKTSQMCLLHYHPKLARLPDHPLLHQVSPERIGVSLALFQYQDIVAVILSLIHPICRNSQFLRSTWTAVCFFHKNILDLATSVSNVKKICEIARIKLWFYIIFFEKSIGPEIQSW